MDIDIIDGQICLNGRAAPGSEGFEVRTEGVKKSESGLWVCDKCGTDEAKKTDQRGYKSRERLWR